MFGPFVTVLTFKDDDEALAIANGTEYGLGSGLWTVEPARAHRLAREMQSRHGVDQLVQARQPRLAVRRRRPVGYGREMGFDAMREYTQVKSVWVNVDAQIPPWYVR